MLLTAKRRAAMKTLKKPLYNTCVSWDPDELDCLEELTDSREPISREAFLRYADKESLQVIEKMLGYDQNFPMRNDPCVGYYEHKPTGIRFFIHSAVEYVFASDDQIEELRNYVEQLKEAEETQEISPHSNAIKVGP